MLFERPKRPELLNARSFGIALAVHLGFLVVFGLFAACHGLFDKKEEIIPIDLTVVVNENLEGKENEPPPLKNPDPPPKPEPPQPKAPPKAKEPEKPKELEKIVTNIVTKVDKKETKKPEKKKEKKKGPEKPKKTKEQLRKERLEQMRKSAKVVNKTVKVEVRNARESGDGRTARKTLSDAEIQRLLNMGYKPGTSEQLAANEEQLGYSLIKAAVEAKWDTPPWTDTLRPMTIRVWFGGGGRVVRSQLEQSSGDGRADQSIKTAVSRVGAIPALPAKFIEKYKSTGIPVRFKVMPH